MKCYHYYYNVHFFIPGYYGQTSDTETYAITYSVFNRKLQAYGKVHNKILKDIIRNASERLESTTTREGCNLQEKNKSTVSRIEKHKLSQKKKTIMKIK